MFCGKCGTKLPDTAKFCAKCGARTVNSDANGTAASKADAVSSSNSKIDDLIKRADTLTTEAKWEEAVLVCTEAMKLDGGRAEAYYYRGAAYLSLEKQTQAMRDLSRSIELMPDYADAFYLRGMINYQKGELEDGLADFDTAIQFIDNLDSEVTSDAYFFRGRIYFDQELYEKAIDDCTEAVKLNKDNFKAYNIRGCAYKSIEQNDTALKDFNKAIELNPEYADAFCNRAQALVAQEEKTKELVDDIIADLKRAVELDPDEETYQDYLKSVIAYRYITIKCSSCGEVYTVDSWDLDDGATKYNCPKCKTINNMELRGYCHSCGKVTVMKAPGLIKSFFDGVIGNLGNAIHLASGNPCRMAKGAFDTVKTIFDNTEYNGLPINCTVCGQLHVLCIECGSTIKYPKSEIDKSLELNCEDCGTVLRCS